MNPSILYALPAVPIFILSWYSQISSDRKIRQMTKTATPVVADELLKQYLADANLKQVDVVKGENYMENDYVESDGKIHLSPDTIGCVDVASVALALRAGAQANAVLNRPEKTKLAQKLHSVEILCFWLAFCILAFGIMSASAPISVVGYAIVVVVWAVWRYKTNIQSSVCANAIEFLKKSGALPPKNIDDVEQTFRALTRKL